MQGLAANIEAMRIWLLLMEGKNDAACLWLRDKAPDENKHFHILDRYRYLVKVRCYLAIGKYTDALRILSRLIDYFKRYDRTYWLKQDGILLAITQYHMEQDRWQKTLNDSLLKCKHYGFIRFVAEEGAALLPLLQKNALTTDTEYAECILKETRQYALLYSNYKSQNSCWKSR